MIVLSAALTVLMQAAAPAPTCEVTDNACKARQFIDKSRTVPPEPRALYLFTAHRSYLALFAQTGKAQDLCAARASFDRSVGVPGQSEGQRASFEAARAELEALEKQYGVRCGGSAKRRKRVEPTPVAAAAPVAPEPPAIVPAPAPPIAGPTHSELATAAVRPDLRAPVIDEPLELPAPAKPLPSRPRGRPLVIVGGTTLGLGIILAGYAGYAGTQLTAVARASHTLYENAQGQGYADALRIDAKLRSQYHHWLPVTVGTTIAASSAVIVGAVLISLGVRKLKESPSRTALIPVPGGLAIHARF